MATLTPKGQGETMSKRNNTTNSTRTTRSTSNTSSSRNVRSNSDVQVFDPAEYDRGVYKRERKLKRIGMGIRRGDTRHGDYSNVVLWKPTDSDGPSRRFVMTLSEARAFKAFLDRELEVRAR
jgi:hypothetical protein